MKNLNLKCENCTGCTERKNFPLLYNFSLNYSLFVIIIVVVVGGDIDDRVRGYQQESEESWNWNAPAGNIRARLRQYLRSSYLPAPSLGSHPTHPPTCPDCPESPEVPSCSRWPADWGPALCRSANCDVTWGTNSTPHTPSSGSSVSYLRCTCWKPIGKLRKFCEEVYKLLRYSIYRKLSFMWEKYEFDMLCMYLFVILKSSVIREMSSYNDWHYLQEFSCRRVNEAENILIKKQETILVLMI